MNLSGIKLVAVDMDGTLLNPAGELHSDFYPLFKEMRQHNILFTAASGRQLLNLQNKFGPVKEEMAFIAENGSYVVHKGEDIFVQAMDPTTVKALINRARQIPSVDIILCGKKKAYLENTAPEFMRHVNMYYDSQQVVPDLLQVEDDEFLKIAICDLGGSEKNSLPHFTDLQDRLQVKVSGHIWLDLSHKLANKGTALNVLQQRYNITAEETMVFGDYMNDLEMMQQAYYSYAMENAHEEIKKTSRFNTKSNAENGVGIVLRQMLDAVEARLV
jgi:hypothetical protein